MCVSCSLKLNNIILVFLLGAPPAAPQVDLDGLLSNLLAKGLIGKTPASTASPVSAPGQPQGTQNMQQQPAVRGGQPGPGQAKPAFDALVSVRCSLPSNCRCTTKKSVNFAMNATLLKLNFTGLHPEAKSSNSAQRGCRGNTKSH